MDLGLYFLSISFIFLILTSILLVSILNKHMQLLKLPPGPKMLPVIGNLHQVGNWSNIRRLSNKYGPLMFLQLGSKPALVISSTDIAKTIFDTHDPIFSGRPQLYVAKKLSFGCIDIAFAPSGKQWRYLKKHLVSQVLHPLKISSFDNIREEEVTLMVDTLGNFCGRSVNVTQVIFTLVANVVCRAAFGRICMSLSRFEDGGKNYMDTLLEIQVLLADQNIADFYPFLGWINRFNGFDAKFEKIFKDLNDFFEEVVGDHLYPRCESLDEHEDLIDVLLKAQKNPSQGGTTITNEQIKAVIMDVFIGGTDPSWATLVWAMVLLIKNPAVMKRAQDEVREIVHGKSRVEESDLPKLDYLKAILKETLRLHPPNPFPRETTEECEVMGYQIPAKTRVLVDAKAISRDPKYWADPNCFKPERFMPTSSNRYYCYAGIENISEIIHIPFGVGRRGCPGHNFAMPLLELAFASLMYNFDWRLPTGMGKDDVDGAEAAGLTTHKKIPLSLLCTRWIP